MHAELCDASEGRGFEPDLSLLVNGEAEQMLLGSLMIHNRAYRRIAEIVDERKFGNALHGRIFAAIGQLHDQGIDANPTTLRHLFDHDAVLASVDAARYLARIAEAGAMVLHPEDYAGLIADLAGRRELIIACRDTIADATKVNFDRSARDIVARHQGQLAAIAAAGPGRLNLIDPATLTGVPVPEREWIVPDWIPAKRVTGLYGRGGEGKTTLAQMLATAAAIGQTWLGMPVRRCRSILFFCEDDEDEMHLRQNAINHHYDCTWEDLANMRFLPRLGHENTLMTFENGRAVLMPLFEDLLLESNAFGVGLIFADTVADVFGGNEIDRGQVRKFVQEGLGRLARKTGAAVVALAHPSQSGISSRAGTSGSTAWEGTFRSHLYLKTSQPDGSKEEVDPDGRTLTRKKANYARRDETIELRWQNGVFIATKPPSGMLGTIDLRACERVFLDLLNRFTTENRPLSPNSRSSNYAPRLFAHQPDRKGFKVKDFEGAMQRLFATCQIKVAEYGRKSDSRTKIVRAVTESGQAA
jgi:RecA-family ATPase